MSRIELENVDKYYDKVHVLKDVNLTIEEGEFMTLLGPSGCGKTTTLRVISGLENPQKGTVVMDGTTVADPDHGLFLPPAKRNLNLVFQSYALWPHMTVFDNVAFGLTVRKMPKAEIAENVMAALKTMRIQEFARRYPSELSGGQQQRVAIARAIVSRPKILLLDEPLSNLDAKLRIEMRAELKRLHRELKTTIIYVTHDQVEALTMSTKIAVYFEGVMTQCGAPSEIYNNPATLRVAEFIGNPKINFLEGKARIQENDSLAIEGKFGTARLSGLQSRNGGSGLNFREELNNRDVVAAVRPEHVHLHDRQVEGSLECTVSSVLPAGSETLLELELGEASLMAKMIGQQNYDMGQKLWVSFEEACMNVYDKASGNLAVKAS